MSFIFVVGAALSVGVGLLLGLIGGGGSIVTVPVLVYLFEVPPNLAVPMSLPVVGGTSLLGAYLHHRRGNVEIKTGLMFGIPGILGAVVGSPLTRLVSPSLLLLVFGTLMLVVAFSMLLQRKQMDKQLQNVAHPARSIASGFIVGVLTGFLGVGGGFLIVPALVNFGGLTTKNAIGTSLFVIFLSCLAGFVSHMSQDLFDLRLTFFVTALALGGATFGAVISHRLEARRLQQIFAVIVLLVGGFLVAKNAGALF